MGWDSRWPSFRPALALILGLLALTAGSSDKVEGVDDGWDDASRRVRNAAALNMPRAERERAVDDSIELAAQVFEKGRDSGDAQSWYMKPRRRHSIGGMATREECETVRNAAKLFTVPGRQCITSHILYDNESPYTPREKVSSVRSVQAARLNNSDPETYGPAFNTFLSLAARVRRQIMTHFNQSELYYHLTEIVCRSTREWESVESCVEQGCMPACMENCPEDCMATPDAPSRAACERTCNDDCSADCNDSCSASTWLSHPLHADANPEDCDMLDNGLCVRRLPQDFTTHLYLNEDFDGGEFFFVHDDGEVDEIVQPTCGRMLAYSSGMENQHGVKGVTSGERCLVTLWLTPDIRKAEELPLPESSPFLDGRLRGPGRGIGK